MSRCVGLRSWLIVLTSLIAVCAASNIANSQVHVRGYYRKDGTYVQPHVRSNPDGNFWNNWSTQGNINPYTGKEGTRVTPPSGYGGSFLGQSYVGGSYISNSYRDSSAIAVGSSDWIDNPNFSGTIPTLRTSDSPTENTLHDIEAINYHGVGFSTTHQQFLRVFPHAKPASPTDSAGVISYAIEDVDGKRDAVWFQFLDDQFLRLVFAYGEARIVQYGGTQVLSARAKQRFGPPTRVDSTTATWVFPTIDRLVMTQFDGKNWYLVVTRLAAQQSVNSKRAEVDVGF